MANIYRISTLLLLLCCFQTGHAEWIKQDTQTLSWLRDVFFVNPTTGWIVGTDGVMLSTDNGGQTWRQSPKFTTDALIQVHFTSESTGWLLCERNAYTRGANAISYLQKTTNGGRNWEKIEFQEGGRARVTRLIFNKDGIGTAFGENGIFYKLQDDGTTWRKSPSQIRFLLLDGAFSDGSVGAIVGTGGTILFTQDSGLTWEKASVLGDADTRFNAVYFAGQKNACAVGSKGRIFRSSGGQLWRQTNSGTTSDLNDVFFTSPANGWAVGDNGTILRTRDAGTTWTEANSHVTHRLEKIVFSGERGWAVGFGGTVLTYNLSVTNPATDSKPASQRRN